MRYSVDVIKEIRLIRTVIVTAESGEEAYEKAQKQVESGPKHTYEITNWDGNRVQINNHDAKKWNKLDESIYSLVPPTPLKEEEANWDHIETTDLYDAQEIIEQHRIEREGE